MPTTNRWKWIASGLAVALVASNAYWMYLGLYAAEDIRGATQQINERGVMIRQLQDLLPRTMPIGSKELVFAEASKLFDEKVYEKGGVLWTDSVGWVFESDGRVKWIIPAWCCDPDLLDADDLHLRDAM